ncbi:hypothetical protein [Micromonospora purpureochromogenes]|nr:hypothetical protein [Micromonospora purpureochromogenes]
MDGEDRLSARVRRHLAAVAPFGIDDGVMKAIDEVIESHVIEMKATILRHHTVEEVEQGDLQARIDGLITQFDHESEGRSGKIKELEYVKQRAVRAVEQRDTPEPAGPDGEEDPGPSYQSGNVGELAGRGWIGQSILYIVLLFAMVADLITFNQVVERILNDARVWPLVAALAVTTTYVAHWAGEGFKRVREQRRNVRRAVSGWSLLGLWLSMGLGAFALRLLAPELPSNDAQASFISGAAPPTDASSGLGAMVLLLLYLLTGAIAFTAGYRRPREEVGQVRRSDRRLRRARPRHGALLRDVAEARTLRQQLDHLRDSRKRQYVVEVDRCESAARRVRAEAAMLVRRFQAPPESGWRRLVRPRRMPTEPTEPGPDTESDPDPDVDTESGPEPKPGQKPKPDQTD